MEVGSQLEDGITIAMLLTDSLRGTLLWDRLMMASAPPSPHMRHPIKWTVSELDIWVKFVGQHRDTRARCRMLLGIFGYTHPFHTVGKDSK